MEEYKRRDGKNAKRYERTITYDKICNICGEHFIAKVWNAKTCKKPECVAANAAIISATREQRYNNGELSSVLADREFICERCNKTFIKHTTNRKKFKYCDDCAKAIKEETYIYNKIQKYGTAACVVGSGNNAIYEDEFPDKMLVRGNNDFKVCYICGKSNIDRHAAKIEEHHLNNIHDFDIPYNKVYLCSQCHNRLHRIYNRLKQLGVIFPTSITYKGKTYKYKPLEK